MTTTRQGDLRHSGPVDGFRTAYERVGSGPPVVLLHGWPGDRHDHRLLAPLLAPHADVLVPDLRGFGESDKHAVEPSQQYDAAAQARSVVGLVEELGLEPVVLAGYDVGSRVAQAVARSRPDLVRGLVVSPPLPGAGDRVLSADAQPEFWYQAFHQLALVEKLLDGSVPAVRAYLEHFWQHWSGPAYVPDPDELDRLAGRYGAPGAFVASISWYRAGAGMIRSSLAERAPEPAERLATPTIAAWPAHDPLFPQAWSDRLDEFFVDVELRELPGSGHFTPLESPQELATAVVDLLART